MSNVCHCCELVLPVALISFSSRTEEVLLNDGMPRYVLPCFDPEGEPIDSLSLSLSVCVCIDLGYVWMWMRERENSCTPTCYDPTDPVRSIEHFERIA